MAVEPLPDDTPEKVVGQSLSVSWIFEETLNFYRDHFLTLFVLFLIAGGISWGVQYYGESLGESIFREKGLSIQKILDNPEEHADDLLSLFFDLFLVFLLMTISIFLVSLLFHAVAIQYTYDGLMGGEPRLGDAFSQSLPSYPRLVAASLLVSIITILGLIALVIPGIILSLMFILVPQAVVLGKKGPISALTSSNELTSGNKTTIFLFFVFWAVVLLLTYMVLGLFERGVVVQGVEFLVSALFAPVFPISTTVIYNRVVPPVN